MQANPELLKQALEMHAKCGSSAEAARQLGISASTFKHRLETARRQQGEVSLPVVAVAEMPRSQSIELDAPGLPSSLSKEWTPHLLDGRRIGVISDIHVPYHDVRAVAAAVKYLKDWRCDTLLINGDGMDFYQSSRYLRDPSKERLKREVEIGKEFTGYIRGQFPNAEIYWKLGNHEERWYAYLIERAPDLFEIASNIWQDLIGGTEYGVKFIGDQRIIYAGGPEGIAILHGHELGRGTATPVNPARTLQLRLMESAMCGHFHRTSNQSVSTGSGRQISCFSVGCLCYMRPEYARFNQWDHAFATIEVGGPKDWHFTAKKIIDGRPY